MLVPTEFVVTANHVINIYIYYIIIFTMQITVLYIFYIKTNINF